jgi:hypothetical protein
METTYEEKVRELEGGGERAAAAAVWLRAVLVDDCTADHHKRDSLLDALVRVSASADVGTRLHVAAVLAHAVQELPPLLSLPHAHAIANCAVDRLADKDICTPPHSFLLL